MIFLSLSMEFFSLPLLYRVSPCTCNSNQQAVENWLPRKYAKHVLALWDTILQEGFLIMLNELRISGTFNSKITFPQNVIAFATPFIIVLSPFSGACGVEGGIFDWPLKPADSQWKGKIPLRLSHSSHNAKTAFHPLLHLPPLSKMADGWRVSVLFRLKKMIKRNSYLNLLCPGGGGGGKKKQLFPWHSVTSCSLRNSLQTHSLIADLLNEGVQVGRSGCCKSQRSQENCNKRGTVMEQ